MLLMGAGAQVLIYGTLPLSGLELIALVLLKDTDQKMRVLRIPPYRNRIVSF